MSPRIRFSTLQAGLVFFWAAWLTVVTLSNLTEGLKALGILSPDFGWASYNHGLIRETVAVHGVPGAVAGFLFAGVIAWELLATFLLWRAWYAMRHGASGHAPVVTQAFAVSLGLWCAFLVATEVFINYATAPTHKSTLIAQLATLVVVRLRED